MHSEQYENALYGLSHGVCDNAFPHTNFDEMIENDNIAIFGVNLVFRLVGTSTA